jgi:glycosyltransferase involved in cell wall biosynthesis
MSRKTWLIVCKPLRPPLRDGSTVLVSGLVRHMQAERRLCYLGDPAAPLRPGDDVIAAPPAGYSPTLGDKLRALAAMLRRPGSPIHLCFTPGRATAGVVRLLRLFQRRRPIIQTLMSSHGAEQWVSLLRPLDVVVAQSRHTANVLVEAGFPQARLAVLPPAVDPVAADPPERVAARRNLLYAGDLDPEIAARLLALARAMPAGWSLTIACRPKAEGDAEARELLKRELPPAAELLAEVPDIDALQRRSALQLFAATHTRRKVDLPLVLLEGLARGVPVAIVGGSPAVEILSSRPAGLIVPAEPDAFARAVVAALHEPALADMSREAASLAAGEFSLPALARRYDDLYASLEGLRPGGP